MRLNHEYWCEQECTWQTNSINKTATSERLDSWASRLWRGIELVFKSLNCFTVRPNFSTRPITRIPMHSNAFQFQCNSNAFTIWCCIPISRPPRVIRRFKRRSCYYMLLKSKPNILKLYKFFLVQFCLWECSWKFFDPPSCQLSNSSPRWRLRSTTWGPSQ